MKKKIEEIDNLKYIKEQEKKAVKEVKKEKKKKQKEEEKTEEFPGTDIGIDIFSQQ